MKAIKDSSGATLAVILNMSEYHNTGSKQFFSEPDDSLQIGALTFQQGEIVPPHMHKQKAVSSVKAMEIIMVLGGVVEATIYDNAKQPALTLKLFVGDVLIQKSGGHGFTFTEKSSLIEVKTGPYSGKDSDKELIS